MDHRTEQIANDLLVLRCQEGDSAAFGRLVRQWQERLWRYALRLTRNEDAAWDIVQETWFAVAKGVSRLEDVSGFSAWAFQIVSHKARDWIRRESRGRRAFTGYLTEKRNRTPTAQADGEKSGTLDEILAGLPLEIQMILELRYGQDFDTRQIAEILSIPEGTAKSRLYYARQHLKKILMEES